MYTSFSTTVAENLQLVITDVHFRYEDATLNPEKPFAFGITIGKLAARSTDDKWVNVSLLDYNIKFHSILLQLISSIFRYDEAVRST